MIKTKCEQCGKEINVEEIDDPVVCSNQCWINWCEYNGVIDGR